MRIFFATDLHGSDRAFHKFVAAAKFYSADILFLGGDLSGKALVPVWRTDGNRWGASASNKETILDGAAELAAFERTCADQGVYAVKVEPEQYHRLDGVQRSSLLEKAICARLESWLEYAEMRLRNTGICIVAIPGNDDPLQIDGALRSCPAVTFVDRQVVNFDGMFQVLGLGYSTPTPWQTPRELPDEEIDRELQALVPRLNTDLPAIFHIHVPPFSSGLDLCPELDKDLRPVIGVGGPVFRPVGSMAVQRAIQFAQPILGLFGHVHEARATARIGSTFCVNPGSAYAQGILLGCLIVIAKGRVEEWFLTEG